MKYWKKPKGGLEDLDTPVQNNNRAVLFLVLILVFTVHLQGWTQNALQFEQKGETKKMKYDFALSEALKYKMLGNSEESTRYLNQCMELLPEKPVPYYEKAIVAFNEKKFIESESLIQEAINRDPENKWYRFLQLQVLIAQERFHDAANEYFGLYEKEPQEKEYMMAAINLWAQAKEDKLALKHIKQLKKDEDYRAEAMIREKEIYLREGKDKKALKVMREVADENPDQIEYRGILAELLAEKGYDQQAVEEYKKIIDSNPDNPIVYFSLGQFYYDKNKRKEAIQEFITGFRSKQVNPDVKYKLFVELASDNQADSLNSDLVSLLEAMYEADQGHPGIDALYADYQYNLGHTDEAEVVYKRVVANNPGNFMAWQRLLFIQNDQLDFQEMYNFGKQASRAFPSQSLFYLFHGIACNSLKKYEEAVEVLKKGKRLNSGNADLTKQYYVSLGDALYHAGKPDEAFQNYELALVLDSENPLVLNNYAYYLSVENRDLDKALKMIEKCISLEPENSTYLDTYAWVLFKQGEYQKALENIKSALAYSEDEISGEVWEHFGDILFQCHQVEQAVDAWQKAKGGEGVSEGIDEKINKRSLDVEK